MRSTAQRRGDRRAGDCKSLFGQAGAVAGRSAFSDQRSAISGTVVPSGVVARHKPIAPRRVCSQQAESRSLTAERRFGFPGMLLAAKNKKAPHRWGRNL